MRLLNTDSLAINDEGNASDVLYRRRAFRRCGTMASIWSFARVDFRENSRTRTSVAFTSKAMVPTLL